MSNYSALEHMLDHCLAIEQFMNDFECKNVEDFIRLTDQMVIRGNVYDDWHIAPVKP